MTAGEELGDLIGTFGSVDHDEIDWPNVLRTTYLVHQRASYAYPGPIRDLRQRLMLVPPDAHGGQRLVTSKIRIGATCPSIERSYDSFGNVVLDVSVDEVEASVDFTVWLMIERAGEEAAHLDEPIGPDRRLLRQSALTRPDAALRQAAKDLLAGGAEGEDLAEAVTARVHEHFRYEYGITDVATTAAEAWRGAVGVCQDYAHAMLALCRLCALPARYVSGHLLGEGGTHAWVEVLLPHPEAPDRLRAVAFDPTHGRRAGLKYITVAVGRDYGDVAPYSGTFVGPYGGELSAQKHAAVTRVEYLAGR